MQEFIATVESEAARSEMRRMFNRTLSAWAMDVLELRRRGLDRPGVRTAEQPAAPWKQAA